MINDNSDLQSRIAALGLLDPTDRQEEPERRAAIPLETLEGLTGGFLDNHKGNADVILEAIRRELAAGYGITDSVVLASGCSRPRRRRRLSTNWRSAISWLRRWGIEGAAWRAVCAMQWNWKIGACGRWWCIPRRSAPLPNSTSYRWADPITKVRCTLNTQWRRWTRQPLANASTPWWLTSWPRCWGTDGRIDTGGPAVEFQAPRSSIQRRFWVWRLCSSVGW